MRGKTIQDSLVRTQSFVRVLLCCTVEVYSAFYYLNAQSFVDRQHLEHERQVSNLLLIPKVVGVRLQEIDQEHPRCGGGTVEPVGKT